MLACALIGLVAVGCGSDDQEDGDGGGGAGGTGSGSGATTGSGGTGNGLPECADICVGVVAENCPGGPPTQADCVNGCEMIRMGPCADVYATLAACAGADPDLACDENGAVLVVGCETENAELTDCLAAGGG